MSSQAVLCLPFVINPLGLLESEPGSVGVKATLPNAELPLQWVRNDKGLKLEFCQRDDELPRREAFCPISTFTISSCSRTGRQS